jgi:hypothetical protein
MNMPELFEGAGHVAAVTMLDKLLIAKTQGDAVAVIHDFLRSIGEAEGEKELRYTCAGAASALVDVLMIGMAEIKNRRTV